MVLNPAPGNRASGFKSWSGTDPKLQEEMTNSSKAYRPFLWEQNPAYNSQPEEIMADNIARWLMTDQYTRNTEMPLFTAKYGAQLQPYLQMAQKYLPTVTGAGQWRSPTGETLPPPGPPLGHGAPAGTGPTVPPPPPGTTEAAGGAGGTTPPGTAVGAPAAPHDPWPVVASRYAKNMAPPSIWTQIKRMGVDVYRQLWSGDDGLTTMQRWAEGIMGARMPDAENPQMLRRLMELSETSSQTAIHVGMVKFEPKGDKLAIIGKSFNDIIKPFEKESDPDHNFWVYALARQAVEDVVLHTRTTGVDLVDATEVLKQGHAKYGAAFDELTEWRNGTLAWLRDAGVISAKSYNDLVATGRSMPLERQESLPTEHVGGQGGAAKDQNSGVKAAKDSELLINHPAYALLRLAERRFQTAREAVHNRAVVDMLKQVGAAARTDVAPTPTSILMPSGTPGMPPVVAEVLAAKLGWAFKNDELHVFRDGIVEKWKLTDFAGREGMGDAHAAITYLKGLDRVSLSTFGKMAQGFADWQRKMSVVVPTFPIRLLTYDTFFQAIVNPEGVNPLSIGWTGVKALFDPAKMRDWELSGGAERIFERFNRDKYVQDIMAGHPDPAFGMRAWNVVSSPAKAMLAFANNMSKIMRVGRYIQGQERGESNIRSAVASTDMLLHRNSGVGPLGASVNSVQPFFIGYLKNLERTFQAQFGLGESATGEKYDWKSFTMKTLAMVTLPAMALWWKDKDKAWYKASPEWMKNSMLQINVGSDEHPFVIPIPLPPLIGFFYAGLPRALAQSLHDHSPQAFKGWGENFGTAFAPPTGAFAASLLTPILENITNYSFQTGSPLVSDAQKERLTPDQYRPGDTALAKELSRFLGGITPGAAVAPEKIDNLIQGWAGTGGKLALQTAEQGLTAAGIINKNAPAKTFEDNPLLHSWGLRHWPSSNAQPIEDFYSRMDTAMQTHNSLGLALRNQDFDRFKEVTQQNPTAAVLHHFSSQGIMIPKENAGQYRDVLKNAISPQSQVEVDAVSRAYKAVTTLSQFANAIRALPLEQEVPPTMDHSFAKLFGSPMQKEIDGKVTARDKQQILDQVYSTMQAFSEEGLKAMDKAGFQ